MSKRWYQKWWGVVIILALLISLPLGASLGYKILQNYAAIKNGMPSFSDMSKQKELTGVALVDGEYVIIPTVDDDPAIGPADAKVKVIAFEDFQCPYCAEEFPEFRATIEKYKDRVLFVYRDFAYPESAHEFARPAAEAAECLADQGKFWEFHDLIFSHQDKLSLPQLSAWASQLGADMAEFTQCADARRYQGEVEKDYQDGQYAGVAGTPTFFINGYKVQGTLSQANWTKILDYLLSLY